MRKKLSGEYLAYVIEQSNLSARYRDWDGIVVDDTSKVPLYWVGEVLHINDHGNATLYRAFKNGNLRELASRV